MPLVMCFKLSLTDKCIGLELRAHRRRSASPCNECLGQSFRSSEAFLRLMMIDPAFCAVVATTRSNDHKPAYLLCSKQGPVHISRCQKRHSALARSENISQVPQGISRELPNKSNLTILFTASRIARPNDLASQVTDDTLLSVRRSQNHRNHGYPRKQRIETPARLCRLFLPTRAFVLP
jgi:hypothetical protein